MKDNRRRSTDKKPASPVRAVKSVAGADKLAAEAVGHEQQLDTFSDIGKALISSLDLKEVLAIVLEKVSELFNPKDWSLLLIDELNGDLKYEIVVGEDSEKIRDFRPKLGEGIAGYVANHGVPLIVPDVKEDPRFAGEIETLYSFVTGPVVCVPLKTKGRTLGVIELYNVEDGHLQNSEDMHLLTTIADYTAIAIENAMLFKKVQNLTITDDLTLLHNARFFHSTLEYELKKAKRYANNLSMIFMDLDFFKEINDRYGHVYGSTLLKEVGELLKNSLRTVDIACRYGGDEFVILMPETSKKSAIFVAERLRVLIKKTRFLRNSGLDCRITASFGVGTFPEDATSKLMLLHVTDKAMYSIKNQSRNGVAAHNSSDENSKIFL